MSSHCYDNCLSHFLGKLRFLPRSELHGTVNFINAQIINQAKSADNAERDILPICHAGELGSLPNELGILCT